jgi:hypothetical protein
MLNQARTIVLVDWPSREVPDTLARLGWTVIAQEGPDRYVAYEAADDVVTSHATADAPTRADLVYSYRPLDELDGIIELARALGAHTVWLETEPARDDLPAALSKIEAAGMTMETGPIARSARAIRP